MARERTGWIGQDEDERWFYRYQYTDSFGVRRNVRRLAKNESDAKSKLRKALNKFDNGGAKAVEGERVTFGKLASKYAAKKIFEPEYVGERKVAGLRSYQHVERLLDILKDHFKEQRISTITHSDIEDYKQKRLTTKKANLKQRTIASVNRELEVLRAMMRFAKQQRWIHSSPFEEGAPIISKADETRRERVLTRDEERRLLDACGERVSKYKRKGRFKDKETTTIDKGEKRTHLRPLIIAALDTAARRGELLQLWWSDVDLDQQLIRLRATTTKTATARTVPMTPRLKDELQFLWRLSPKRLDLEVFGVGSVKRAFANACDSAGIKDLHFHDLRHTAITRMVQTGMPTAQIMKITGHTQMITFQRYVNPTDDSLRDMAKMLHDFNTQAGTPQAQSELVN
ncbi:MAG TPA: site-specific integrase [Pyrinomonadaceae bacterium]|nr:site-specific integrase [Pyrinomonadaceae bacterium]